MIDFFLDIFSYCDLLWDSYPICPYQLIVML